MTFHRARSISLIMVVSVVALGCGDDTPPDGALDGSGRDGGSSDGATPTDGSTTTTDGGSGSDGGGAPVDGGPPAPSMCPRGFMESGDECLPVPGGTSYYVRTDGGNRDQCDGTADAPYVAGGGMACAFRHPFYAIAPRGSSRPGALQGGDVLFIGPGDYAMGAGVIGDSGYGSCDDSSGSYDCEIDAIPSGTADRPTRIVGAGFASGCVDAPELWGTWRTPHVLNLEGSDHVVVACLDITDHQTCTRFHSATEFQCSDDGSGVVEGYAYNGVTASDSEDVDFVDVGVHGLDRGFIAGRLRDWTLTRVNIRGNVAAGFDGDIDGDDHNSGTITFRDGSITWSGCLERYPEVAAEPVGCVSQDRGGYGDGLGTGYTGGNWVFDHFDFLYNVSDGLDLLYLDDPAAHVEVRDSHFEGNAGNALKINQSGHLISNVSVVGNCGFLSQPRWPDMVNPCRALGTAMALGSGAGETVIRNTTVWTEGDCAIDSSGSIALEASVFVGTTDYLQTFEHACFAYGEPLPSVRADNFVAFGFKDSYSGCDLSIDAAGAVGHCTDPMLRAVSMGSRDDVAFAFDLRVSDASPFAAHVPPLGVQPR